MHIRMFITRKRNTSSLSLAFFPRPYIYSLGETAVLQRGNCSILSTLASISVLRPLNVLSDVALGYFASRQRTETIGATWRPNVSSHAWWPNGEMRLSPNDTGGGSIKRLQAHCGHRLHGLKRMEGNEQLWRWEHFQLWLMSEKTSSCLHQGAASTPSTVQSIPTCSS